uniref:Putative glycoprotein n=1 Tax=Hubei myriapoda virus 6 TaxID=1922935 RepID=A0A1L3KPP1_9VIRU|nr:putative glycoprotein [Hubei myriapoda virus 6]
MDCFTIMIVAALVGGLEATPPLDVPTVACKMMDVQRVGTEVWYVSLTCTSRKTTGALTPQVVGFRAIGVTLQEIQSEEWESDEMPVGYMVAKYRLIGNHQRPSFEDSAKVKLLKGIPKSEDCHGAHQQVRLRSFKPHNSASYRTGTNCLRMVSTSDACFGLDKLNQVEKHRVRLQCSKNCTKEHFSAKGTCVLEPEDVLEKYMCGNVDNEVVVCSVEASSLSCEWSAITTDLGVNMVKVTLTTAEKNGKVSFISGELDTNQLCKHSCLFEVPKDNKFATLICPNGDLHHVAIVRYEPSNCPLAQYSFVRPLALHVCQNTSWPVLLMITLLWILFGRYICSAIVLLQCWLKCKLQAKLARNRRQKEITDCPPSCIFCGCATDNVYMAELHLACQTGVCPFCKLKVTESKQQTEIDIDDDGSDTTLNPKLANHAKNCYSRPLSESIRKDAAKQALEIESQKCQPMRYRMWLGNLYWMLLAVILILILFVPSHATADHGTRYFLGTDGVNDYYRYTYKSNAGPVYMYRSVPAGSNLTGTGPWAGQSDQTLRLSTLPTKIPHRFRDQERSDDGEEFSARGPGYQREGTDMVTCDGTKTVSETDRNTIQVCEPICPRIDATCSPVMKAGCSISCELNDVKLTKCCVAVYTYYRDYYWNKDEADKKCLQESGFIYNSDINIKGLEEGGLYQPYDESRLMTHKGMYSCPAISTQPTAEEPGETSTVPDEETTVDPSVALTTSASADKWAPTSHSLKPGLVGKLFGSVVLLTYQPRSTGVVSAISKALEVCPDSFCMKYGETCSCFVEDDSVVPDHHFPGDSVEVEQKGVGLVRRKRDSTRQINEHQHSMDKLVSDMLMTPWGVVNIAGVWRPAFSRQHSMLEWSNIIEEDDNSLTYSGLIEGELKLEVQTAVKWEVGSKKVKPKVATLSLVEFAQLYTAQLKYITFNRFVTKDSEMTCTGDCHANCSKSDDNRHITKWPNDRRWNCNPGWCWAINNGCTCCVLDYTTDGAKYALMVYDISYESTLIILCFSLGFDSRTCKSIKAGEVETQVMDGITLETSELVGDASRLPEGTTVGMLFNWKGGLWNLVDVDSMLLNPDVCKLNQCSHGQIGDIQLNNLTPLLSGNLATAYKSFQGITANRVCHTGSWPTCTFSNVIPDLTEVFEKLNETSTHISQKYHLMSNRISYKDNIPQVNLELRPLTNYGSLKIKMKVDAMKFTKIQIKIEVTRFEISNCGGCHSCSDGFTCEVKIKVKNAEPVAVHLFSKDPTIQLMVDSVIVGDVETTHKLHGFTVLPETNMTACIKEDNNHCASFFLKLKEIQGVIQLHSEQLFTTQDGGSSSCSFFSCMGDTSIGLGSILAFSLTHFGWWTAIYAIAGVIGVIFITFWLLPYCRGAAAVRYAKKMADIEAKVSTLRQKAITGKQS